MRRQIYLKFNTLIFCPGVPNRPECPRLDCPPACKLPIRVIITPYSLEAKEGGMRAPASQLPLPRQEIPGAGVVAPSPRVRRAAHYMDVMGLWRLPGSQGAPGPLPTSLCNACMMCADCFTDLWK